MAPLTLLSEETRGSRAQEVPMRSLFPDICSDDVPAEHRRSPQGVLVTIEVDDVDAVHARARSLGVPIVDALRSEEFGQRHFTALDPHGLLTPGASRACRCSA